MQNFDTRLRQIALSDTKGATFCERAHSSAALGLHCLVRQGVRAALSNEFAPLGIDESRLARLAEVEKEGDVERYLGFLRQFTGSRAQCWPELYKLSMGEVMPSEMLDLLFREDKWLK